MTFGDVPTQIAAGAILAHSVALPGSRMRKGRVLCADDISTLLDAGITTVPVARLDPDDIGEDAAAGQIAAALRADGMSVSAAFTGRTNLYAEVAGLVAVDRGMVDHLNRIDEAITLATLPSMTRVAPRQMLATVKIIPYGVSSTSVSRAVSAIADAMTLHPFGQKSVSLIQTTLANTTDRMLEKGASVTQARLSGLGLELVETLTCAHTEHDVARAISTSRGKMVLLLGASATSDSRDMCPAGLVAAGGQLIRFGMPVDPGNLLFLGALDGRHVVGLPGCARSPALNGADWVLERLAADLPITTDTISGMGVGGLLKEIPTRPQPRGGNKSAPVRPRIEGIILAAGASSRMKDRDKLMEDVDGSPQLARIAKVAGQSQLDRVQIVLRADDADRQAAVADLGVSLTRAPNAFDGMAASIRAGLSARDRGSDAVMLILADMPDLSVDHLNRLIAAFDPAEGRSIVQATDSKGIAGHPVLFGRRFFEALANLSGDNGAKSLIADGQEFLVTVSTDGLAATTDLDTPEDWAAWRRARAT